MGDQSPTHKQIVVGLGIYLSVLIIGITYANVKPSFQKAEYQSEFSRGWKDGYIDGHHFKHSVPTPKIPDLPVCNSDTCTYMKGYKIAIHKGFNDVTNNRNK